MNQISLSLPTLQEYQPTSKATNERASVVEEFVTAINLERKGTKYKPVKAKRIAIQLSVFKDLWELRQFLSICKEYGTLKGSFSRRYFGGFRKQGW